MPGPDDQGKVLPLTGSGSGKKKKQGTLKLASWNCFGLSVDRAEFLFGSEADRGEGGLFPSKGGGEWIVALQECRGGEQKMTRAWPEYRLVVGEAPPDDDPASGSAILVSPGVGRARIDSGHIGSRITWIQVETAVDGVDLIVVNVYVPHFGRVNPSADDTYRELEQLAQEFEADPRKRRAVKSYMGDFNGRLARAYDFSCKRQAADGPREPGAGEVTSCWSVHHTDNEMGGKLREFLVDHGLFSVASMFQPRRKVAGSATYVPFGKSADRKAAGLDHICVTRTKRNHVVSCRVRWGPAEHRWAIASGMRKDHAMLVAKFRMRVAKKIKQPRVNRAALRTAEGARLAAQAYAEAKVDFRGRLVEVEQRQLDPERQPGPVSLEEIGYSVEGLAQGVEMSGPVQEAAAALDSAMAAADRLLASLAESPPRDVQELPGDYLTPDEPGEDGGVPAAPAAPPASVAPAALGRISLAADCDQLFACGMAALRALPPAEQTFEQQRFSVSEETKQLRKRQVEKVTRLAAAGETESAESRREYNREYCALRRRDFRDFAEGVAEEMEAANSRGDHDAMRRCKRRMPGLRGKGQFGAPTRGADGKRFANMDEVLQWWHSHMTDHWQAPDTEDARPELEEIVRSVRERPVNLSDGRLDRVLRRMKLNKATSADEIPTELYEAVLEARADLYGIVRRIFDEGAVPNKLVVVLFVMLYKGAKKGTVDEFDAYRPIGLLSHAWKLAEAVFMEELAADTELFLEPANQGSRLGRGARDNILRLRIFIDMTLALGLRGVITFLDYSGAFDATSRKFLDTVIRKAGARAELQQVYRSFVEAAKGQVRVRKHDGSTALTDTFELGVGGIQGGMSTPWAFILALSEVLQGDEARMHDLDFAIRRACLEMEIERRTVGGEPGATHSDELEDSDLSDSADPPGQDAAQREWNAAVNKGAKALLAARDNARKQLHTREDELADAEMRPARWIDPDLDDDEDGGQLIGSWRTWRDAPSSAMDGEEEAGAAASISGAKGGEPRWREPPVRLTQLHEVRIPPGAVDRCHVCEAAVVREGFCAECTGLLLHEQPVPHWTALQREAAVRRRERDTAAATVRAKTDEDGEEPPTPAAPDSPSPSDGAAAALDGPAGSLRSRERGQLAGGRGSGQFGGRRQQSRQPDTRERRLMGGRLGYVDDLATIEADKELQNAVDIAGERVSQIAEASRTMANQHMNARKCGSLLVQPEDAVGDTTAEDVAALKLQHQCECWEMFGSVWGLRSHRNSCARAADAFENEGADADGEHQVEAFLDVRGRPDNRFWRIKWAGKDDTGADLWPDTGTGDGTADFGWQSERNLNVGCVTLQNKFWRDHRALDRRGPCDGPEGEHRCQWCNTFFKSGAALRRHQAGPKKSGVRRTKANSCRLRPKRRRLKGTEVDRMVQREKRKALLNNATQVRMEGRSLQNKIEQEYLGHMFQGDGGCDVDVARRTAIARSEFNKMGWIWRSKKITLELKIRLFESHVLSSVVWGSEGWVLTEQVQLKLNGWCARCMAVITGTSVHENASQRTQLVGLPGIIRYRRMTYLGHLLRAEEGNLTRRLVLRFVALLKRKLVNDVGTILMDAPAFTSVKQLVGLAGGSGSAEDRKAGRRQWRAWARQLLGAADLARRKRAPKGGQAIEAKTAEQTAVALAETPHRWRFYTDGGCDGNGAGGDWGVAAFGATVSEIGTEDDTSDGGERRADLYGPVDTNTASPWFLGAERGTNQTGECCGVAQALMWLLVEPGTDAAVICVDSLYAANESEGYWSAKSSRELVANCQDLLKKVREKRDVTFVHVKGHSDDVGNDRADELVQWGKTRGPYSRLRNEGKDGEGDGRSQPLTARTDRIVMDGESVLILQLGEAPSSVASDGSRPSNDEGGWPLEELRGLLQRPMQWEGIDGMTSIPQDAREWRATAANSDSGSEVPSSPGTVLRHLLSLEDGSADVALLESGSSLALEALAARMRDWSISAYGGSVVSAELSLSQVSRPND